ncbi:MAG TPA: nucleotide kinase domain-containing protein [Rhizomicrobium sp.]|jgi:hypothetical protein
MSKGNFEPLWQWVTKREAIRVLREAGEPPPWTDDAALANYRFCNVRREDDSVTIWIRQNIREPFRDHPYLWFMLCAARVINWPPTLRWLIGSDGWPTSKFFSLSALANELNEIADSGDKVFTGAYTITAPSTKGTKKTDHVAQVTLGNLWRDRARLAGCFVPGKTLQSAHAALRRYNCWGPFMAYQAVVDMRFTALMEDASDRETWAAAGPGTMRGLNRIYGRPLNTKFTQPYALSEMREIYRLAFDATGVRMDFSDVPNILCETDKYLRVLQDEGAPRARYVPSARP